MKNWIAVFLLLVIVGCATAQQSNQKNSWQFHSVNSVGLLEGEAGNAFQLQTVNGAGYKSWFAGIGIGMDYYRFRTVPLFLDLRKDFFKGPDKLFAYADAGISFAWVTDQQKLPYPDDHFSNGFYNDFGLGYKRKVGRCNSFLISIGYSFKKTVETFNQVYYTDLFPGEDPTVIPVQKINYSLNRLSIKIGWEF